MTATPALHQGLPRLIRGAPFPKAKAVVILAHGRGADAEDIMDFGLAVADDTVALIALQAQNNTWYPERFMEPIAANEPWLSSALLVIRDTIQFVNDNGVSNDRIALMGFSQGACLSLEYAARNAMRYGAVIGVAGGLIGPDSTPRDYAGTFGECPVFLGCGDRDPHIPISRVQLTQQVYSRLGAAVDMRVYGGLSHSIIDDEVNAVRKIIRNISAA